MGVFNIFDLISRVFVYVSSRSYARLLLLFISVNIRFVRFVPLCTCGGWIVDFSGGFSGYSGCWKGDGILWKVLFRFEETDGDFKI